MKISPANNIAITVLLSLLVTGYSSCKKDENKSKKADGIMLDYGTPAADGCGWVVRINQVDYKIENADPSFQQDSLPVKLNYNLLESRYQCGLAANIGFSYIHVNSIKKR